MTTLTTRRSDGNGESPALDPTQPRQSLPTAAVALGTEELLALLVSSLGQHPELDFKTLTYHLQQSDATARDGYWHSAVNEARAFVERLIVGIAESESRRRRHLLSGLTPNPKLRSGYHESRKYLVTAGFAQVDEMDLFKHIYAIANRKGARPGVTDEPWGHLICHLCWTSSYFLLTRYTAWKSNRRRWPVDRRRSGGVSPMRPGSNGSWRGWLAGVLRRTAGSRDE